MTPLAGQNPGNVQPHLYWISIWTHLFESSNIVDFANEIQFRWYFQFWNQFAEIFLKITHLRWSSFFARRGPQRNDRGECCAPFSYQNSIRSSKTFVWKLRERFSKILIFGQNDIYGRAKTRKFSTESLLNFKLYTLSLILKHRRFCKQDSFSINMSILESIAHFLKWTHLRWSWFFARRGPRTNDRGECCAPFSWKKYVKSWKMFVP